MAAPDVILSGSDIMIEASESALGLTPANTGLLFGSVVMISDLCDLREVGDNVLFDPSSAIIIVDNQVANTPVTYYIVSEDKTFFKEVVPL
jgi:hypothetical protein